MIKIDWVELVIIMLIVVNFITFVKYESYKNRFKAIIKLNNKTAKENYELKKQVNDISQKQIYDLKPKG